jgi:hypothetical protein
MLDESDAVAPAGALLDHLELLDRRRQRGTLGRNGGALQSRPDDGNFLTGDRPINHWSFCHGFRTNRIREIVLR